MGNAVKKSIYNDNANLCWGMIEHFKHSNDNGMCIDIGACYGSYSDYYVSLFENVVCFEANYHLEPFLKKRLGNYDNIKIHMNGLGNPDDHNTEKVFYAVSWEEIVDPTKARWRGISSYSRDHVVNWTREPVYYNEIKTTIRTLDSYNLAPSFIKMDVEQTETDVIMGAMETILKYRPTLQVEGGESEELIESLGYRKVSTKQSPHSINLTDQIYVYGG